MPKQPVRGGLSKTVAFRIYADDHLAITAAMRRERRIESDVCRALLERGIAAYKRDKQLFEPEARHPNINEAPRRKTGTDDD